MTIKKPSPTVALNSLMLAALAIPGIQGTNAQGLITRPETDFRYTVYDEGNSRYHVDIYLAQLKIGLNDKMDLTVDALQEIQSGASLYAFSPASLFGLGPISQYTEIHSKPTIRSARSEVALKTRYFGEDYHVGIKAIISEEEKYESKTIGIDYTKDFNKQNTELTWGYSYSSDTIKATPQANGLYTIRDSARHERNTHRFEFSIKQDLTTTTVAAAGVEYISDHGFLNDPYKLAFIWGDSRGLRSGTYYYTGGFGVNGTVDLDRRPKFRGSLGGNIKLIQKIVPIDSAVHLGYRYIQNTWSMKSHTFTLDYFQQLGSSLEIVPSGRYYAQTEAYFYAMSFDMLGAPVVGGQPVRSPLPGAKLITGNDPASSDSRLARYGSVSGELKVNYKFLADQAATFTVLLGIIDRRSKYYWGRKNTPKNPDIDFTTYYGSIGLKYVF